MARSARILRKGRLIFGSDCAVNDHSQIYVPATAALEIGVGCYIGRSVELGPIPSGLISIGNFTSIQDRSILLGNVSLGRYCLLAPNVYISSGRHHFDLSPPDLIKNQDLQARDSQDRPVLVEDDCWLGVNVVISPGVVVGKGAVIGANSVVTRDAEPYGVYAGSPARLIRKRIDFNPPKRIDSELLVDFPYFYSGFELHSNAFARNKALGGIVASDTFAVALDCKGASEVTLRIMALSGVAVLLHFEDQTATVQPQITEVTFSLGKDPAQQLKFRAQIRGSRFAVSKVWVSPQLV